MNIIDVDTIQMIVFIFLVVFLRRLAVNLFMQNVLYVQPVQQALKMSVSRKLKNQVNIIKNKYLDHSTLMST